MFYKKINTKQKIHASISCYRGRICMSKTKADDSASSFLSNPFHPRVFYYYFISWQGRIGRLEFIAGSFLILLFSYYVPEIYEAIVMKNNQLMLSGYYNYLSIGQTIIAVITLWMQSVMIIKRLHDRNRSMLWLITRYIPFIQIWLAIETLFLSGKSTDNNYGKRKIDKTICLKNNWQCFALFLFCLLFLFGDWSIPYSMYEHNNAEVIDVDGNVYMVQREKFFWPNSYRHRYGTIDANDNLSLSEDEYFFVLAFLYRTLFKILIIFIFIHCFNHLFDVTHKWKWKSPKLAYLLMTTSGTLYALNLILYPRLSYFFGFSRHFSAISLNLLILSSLLLIFSDKTKISQQSNRAEQNSFLNFIKNSKHSFIVLLIIILSPPLIYLQLFYVSDVSFETIYPTHSPMLAGFSNIIQFSSYFSQPMRMVVDSLCYLQIAIERSLTVIDGQLLGYFYPDLFIF